MKKRALAIVLATAVLLTFVLAAFTASAAPSSLADYEGSPSITSPFTLETTAPISGSASLAYALAGDGANVVNTGWTFAGLDAMGITVTDWSGNDYLGLKIKNTSTTDEVAINFYIGVGSEHVYLPTYAITDVRVEEGDTVSPATASTYPMAGLPGDLPAIKLAAGFEGTVYLPLKADNGFYGGSTTAAAAPYNTITNLWFAFYAAANYSGSVLFDDIALYTAADVPAITYNPLLLTDYENNSAASEVINGAVPDDGTMSYEIITTGALNGSKSLAFGLDPQGASVGQGNVYMKAIGGMTTYANYGYLAIRMKNTDTANDVELNFMFDNASYDAAARQTLTSAANSIIMRTVDNYAVEAVFSEDIYLNIPAGFDGTVYFPISDSTVSEMYLRLRPHTTGEYNGKLIWDDPTLINEDDIPAANAGGNPSASAPGASAPNNPGEVGNTGSSLMLVPAMAAAAAAVVALRKRKA